jgi:glucokinase
MYQVMVERLAVGVDVGGTKLAFALVSERGKVLSTHRVPTQVSDGNDRVLQRIVDGIEFIINSTPDLNPKSSVLDASSIQGIGIGCPGQVDPQTGCVRLAVNMGWKDVPLQQEIKQRLPYELPIYIEQDANAGALGEMYFGAAQGCQDFVYIAVGTGLGIGGVIKGRILSGATNFAMEIGHISLDPNGRQCRCGLRGCPEAYVSGVGLLNGLSIHRSKFPGSALATAESPTTAMILEAAAQHDPLASLIMYEAAEYLGITMAYCAAALNPKLFVIGGGLGKAAAPFLIDKAASELYRRTLPAAHEGLKIVQSQVNESAVGAASLVWHPHNK